MPATCELQRIKVRVTEQHIKLGERGNPGTCPIAIAATGLCGDLRPFVDEVDIDYCDNLTLRRRFKLPDEAYNFIKAYDEGEEVSPFEFEVEEVEI